MICFYVCVYLEGYIHTYIDSDIDIYLSVFSLWKISICEQIPPEGISISVCGQSAWVLWPALVPGPD